MERSANPNIERMLNVFDSHLSTPEENLRFQNQEKFANIWLVLTIQTVMPVGYTILLLSAENKAGKINTMGQVVLRKNVSEKLSIINPL